MVPERLRGTAFGFFSSSLGLISLPAPYIGALLWEKVSPIFPFYIPLLALLAMMPVMWVKFKLPPQSPKKAQTLGEIIPMGAEASADTSPVAG